MILKIILLIIFFQLILETFREGMADTTFDLESPSLDTTCEYNRNIKKPYYNQTLNTYTNKNEFLYNNRENIIYYATANCN